MRAKLLVALLAILLYIPLSGNAQTSQPEGVATHAQVADDGSESITTPVVLLAQAPEAPTSTSQDPAPPEAVSPSPVGQFFKENWLTLIGLFIGFLEAVLRLWPSQEDLSLVNKVISLLKSLLNTFLPNLKAGGGVH